MDNDVVVLDEKNMTSDADNTPPVVQKSFEQNVLERLDKMDFTVRRIFENVATLTINMDKLIAAQKEVVQKLEDSNDDYEDDPEDDPSEIEDDSSGEEEEEEEEEKEKEQKKKKESKGCVIPEHILKRVAETPAENTIEKYLKKD